MMRFAAAALLLCVPLLSQQREPHLKSLEDRKAEWRAEHHIILNLVMKDASGAPASHLSQQDIVLLDNGKPQPLQSFREMTGPHPLEPVHVVVVIDTVNNSRKDLTEQRKALEFFLEST